MPPSLSAARARRLARWVRWLLSELAIPLLRAHFYVTESEAHRHLVLYYRWEPPLWCFEGISSPCLVSSARQFQISLALQHLICWRTCGGAVLLDHPLAQP